MVGARLARDRAGKPRADRTGGRRSDLPVRCQTGRYRGQASLLQKHRQSARGL
ncbi:hypothetical protein PCL1606_31850 [Pseudomonas chlororaphis]|uniref:Uncharacterized protein n=1 Tax=Pseudomonas chlororaphis TaxID=587753 RepID=A0A0D5Y019_9PSED|nr:hypothetical protein PCL1606_31850 [Pseudomonas chlororaphis]